MNCKQLSHFYATKYRSSRRFRASNYGGNYCSIINIIAPPAFVAVALAASRRTSFDHALKVVDVAD